MTRFKIVLLLSIFSFFSFTSLHKYYISVTQIEFVKDKQSVQIISRVFIDDLENALRVSYDKNITLTEEADPELVNGYIEQYINDNLKIQINNTLAPLTFIGKEYDGDIIRFYLEITNIQNIASFKVSSKMLFDVSEDQQNIIKTNINSKHKSTILTIENDTELLNYE